jgi:hypothetical protein
LRRCRITQVFALVAVGCALVAVASAALAGGCSLGVDIDTSHLVCSDGRCPSGFACVAQACVRSSDPSPGTCNPTSLVADDFERGGVDELWGIVYGESGAATSEADGKLRIDVPAGLDGAAYAGYRTDRYYDLTGSSVSVEIATMVNVASHAQMILQLYGTAPHEGDNAGFEQQHGELKLFARTAGQDDTLAVPYDAATMRFWRLSEKAGQLRWGTSADGRAWTIARSVAAPFALTLVRVDVSAGVYQRESDPGVAEFGALNGGTPRGKRCKVGDLADDFEDGEPAPRWANRYEQGSCRLDEQGGALVATTTDAGDGPTYCGYRSAASFDLTGSQLVLEVEQMIEPRPYSPGVAFVKLTASQNAHGVELVELGGRLECRVWDAQQFHTVGEGDWDADADRLWKLEERRGQVTWSTSPDGVTWTPRCAVPTESVDVDDVQVEIGTGVTYSAPGEEIGSFRAARVN